MISPRNCSGGLSLHFRALLALIIASSSHVCYSHGEAVSPIKTESVKEQLLTKEQSNAVLLITTDSGAGSGFACTYRNREFVATNLHVLQGSKPPTIKAQNGAVIKLGDSMVLALDADIAMIAIIGNFEKDYGINPLPVSENVHDETSVADRIVCPGNSLGSNVVLETTGQIKAYGQPRLEITAPVVQGNSGGPVIHLNTGRVIGLVTEAETNRISKNELAKKAGESPDSDITDISYYAHRIDTVINWRACMVADFYKLEQHLNHREKSLINTALHVYDLPGWEEDRSLVDAWNEINRFLDNAAAKTRVRVRRTTRVDQDGVVVRTDILYHSKAVSSADYKRAFDRYLRAIEWKIKGDLEALEKLQPYGYIQHQRRKNLVEFAKELDSDMASFRRGIK